MATNITTESSQATFVKYSPDEKHGNRAPAEALARFSMPEQRRQADLRSVNFPSPGGALGGPMGLPMRSEDVDDDQFDLS